MRSNALFRMVDVFLISLFYSKNRKSGMSVEPFLNAYVQGDWTASPAAGRVGFTTDPNLQKSYDEFLVLLEENWIANTATWHLEAAGVIKGDGAKKKSTDAVRNTRQIDRADCVISYLLRDDPPHKHWGSLCLMGYAVGRGKPCYVIASPSCVIWTSHFVHHPLIKHFHSVEDFLNHFQNKCGFFLIFEL